MNDFMFLKLKKISCYHAFGRSEGKPIVVVFRKIGRLYFSSCTSDGLNFFNFNNFLTPET